MSPIFDKEPKLEKPAEKPVDNSPKKMTIMTELDAYVSESILAQPSEVPTDIKVERDKTGLHRMSLPEPFEKYSFDCTRGLKCKFHKWAFVKEHIGDNKRGQKIMIEKWGYSNRGKFVFRWILKNKRSLDHARSVVGWLLVNRNYFPDIPNHFFSVNGGVELGDSILAFMAHESAVEIRETPGNKSRERLDHELNKHEGNELLYKPKLDPERTEGDDYAPTGALQEGRDF